MEQISDIHDHVQLIGFRRKHTSTWGAAIADVLINAYTLVEIFTEIHRITKRLREMQEKYASVVSPTEKLPDDHNNLIRHFLSFVFTSRDVFLEKLEFLVKRSPKSRLRIRNRFSRSTDEHSRSSAFYFMTRMSVLPPLKFHGTNFCMR